MASHITEIDLSLKTCERDAASPASWHNMETPKEGLSTENCQLRQTKVETGVVSVTFGDETESSPLIIPAVKIPDTGKRHFIGRPYNPETYHLLTNDAFLDFAEQCFNAAGLDKSLSFVSTLDEGRRVILSKEMPDASFKDAYGHEVKTYFGLYNGFDGLWELFTGISSIRTVCFNTATANINAGMVSCRHRPDAMQAFLRAFPDTFAQAVKEHKGNANDYLLLSQVPLTVSDAMAFFAALLSTGKMSTKAYNVMNESLLPQFSNASKGTYGKSAADAYNAVTYHYTHHASAEANAPEGGADSKKREALQLLLSDSLPDTLEKGRKAIAEYLAKK
jgi:hypothetical protein